MHSLRGINKCGWGRNNELRWFLRATLTPPRFRRRAGIASHMWPFHCMHCPSLTCPASGSVAPFPTARWPSSEILIVNQSTTVTFWVNERTFWCSSTTQVWALRLSRSLDSRHKPSDSKRSQIGKPQRSFQRGEGLDAQQRPLSPCANFSLRVCS